MAADGAGSASFSASGAEIACSSLLRSIREALAGQPVSSINEALVREWVLRANQAIAIGAPVGRPLREYACTVLVAILGESHSAYLQVGDGAMVVRDGDERWNWVFWPQHGEFVNSTVFLTDADVLSTCQFGALSRRAGAIALFTDGLERLVLDFAQRTVHEPFFERMISPLGTADGPGLQERLSGDLAEYLQSDAVRQRTDDDLTLILAIRSR